MQLAESVKENQGLKNQMEQIFLKCTNSEKQESGILLVKDEPTDFKHQIDCHVINKLGGGSRNLSEKWRNGDLYSNHESIRNAIGVLNIDINFDNRTLMFCLFGETCIYIIINVCWF